MSALAVIGEGKTPAASIRSNLWMDKVSKLLTANALRRQLRVQSLTPRSQRDVAAMLGVSEQHLSNVLSGKRQITASFAAKMGFKRVVAFEPLRPPEDERS